MPYLANSTSTAVCIGCLRARLDGGVGSCKPARRARQEERGSPTKIATQPSTCWQDQITNYAFNCENFTGITDGTAFWVFARINAYSVQLDAQELRNDLYVGVSKQGVYADLHESLEYLNRHLIVTDESIA